MLQYSPKLFYFSRALPEETAWEYEGWFFNE